MGRWKIASLILIACASAVHADPLDTVPAVEAQDLRFVLDFRADAWTSPHAYKRAPLRIFNGKFRVPLVNTESTQASIGVNYESLNLGRSDVRLGKQSIFIGKDLEDQNAGVAVRRLFEDGSEASFFLSSATSSDAPSEPRNSWIGAAVLYRSVEIERHRWVILVNQSQNRGINNGTPFVYAGVAFEASPRLTVTAGLPFLRLAWTKDEEHLWSYLLNVTPFGIHFDAQCDLQDDFVFESSVGLSSRSYLHDARVDENDRLYYQEIFLDTAVRKRLSAWTGILFGLGATVDRRLYESERIYVPNSTTVRLENDFYGRIALEYKF